MHTVRSDSGYSVHLYPIGSVSPSGRYTGFPQHLAQDLFQGNYYQGVVEPSAAPGSGATGQTPWNNCLRYRIAPVHVASF
jgi:hypothetical protein